MFSIFRKLFGKPENKQPDQIQYAPGTRIPYRHNLIDELVSEHHTLLQVFRDILKAQRSGNNRKVYQLLNDFKTHLRAHLLKENTFLYIYLKHVTQGDAYSSGVVTELQQEMGHIGKAVFGFVQKWTRSSDTVYDDNFLRELKPIGEALVKRIENEEHTLYNFYTEPGTYS